MTIEGTVMDTNVMVPVNKAVAMAIRVRDSVLLDFKRTDSEGKFNFILPVDTVQLIVRHPDYNDFNSYFFGSAENNSFELNPLAMPDKSTELSEFVVFANRTPIYYRGDTLIYVADSFKVKEGAVVEDLLKKLPGIKVDADGKITSQGQEIGQVLVDGDEFFGSDPTIATKNLAAKGVESVQVYEKDSEDGSDEKIQVLDLKLKEEAKKGYFGKVAGGTDFQRFYEGEFLLNRYNSRQKIAVFGLGSNTPKSNFDFGDSEKFGLSSDRGNWMNESDDGMEWNAQESSRTNSGIPQTLRAGFYLDQQLWKGGEVRVNYTYNDNRVVQESISRSQNFLNDTTYITEETARTVQRSTQNQIGLKFKQQVDSLTRFEIESKLTLADNSYENRDETDYRSQRDSLIRSTDIDNTSEGDNATLNSSLRVFRNFNKKNRRLIARYNVVLTDNKTDGLLFSIDRDAATDTINQFFDQKKENRTNTLAQTAYANYVEPLGKSPNWKAEFEYEFYRNDNDQRKSTFNRLNGDYSVLDPLFSNQFSTTRIQNRAGAFLVWENAKSRISVGSRVRKIGIDNVNVLSDTLIRQDMTNVLPRVVLQHKFSNTTRLRFQYNTSSSLPTVNQLQPVQDNSNPNYIQVGNPDLKPNYTHNMNLNFNTWQGLTGFYVYSGLNYTVQQNAFSTSVTYDEDFRTYSQAINVDHADYGSFYGGTGFALPGKLNKFRTSVNANVNYSTTQNIISGQINRTRNTGIGNNLDLNYNGDSLSAAIGAGYEYTIPSNSLSSASNQPYANYNLYANFDWTLPFKFFVRTDITYTINTRRTAGFSVNYAIWNATIERAFLKTGNLRLGVEAYDLLNQNTAAYRTVTTNVITDNITNIITRYFLAKITWRFNNMGTKEEVNNDRW
jgi:hypothetical protein